MKLIVPADVPEKLHATFKTHYTTVTKNTDRILLFAADQKMEHLNQDFSGSHLPEGIDTPDHLFHLARTNYFGAFAAHVGLIARYAGQFPGINYIAKLNGKTNAHSQEDPYSKQLWTVQDALALEHAHICGVGYTIYLGSTFERDMLTEAAQIVTEAHRHGLLAVLWIYPRGSTITNEADPGLTAGAAGVAASLGADVVKIKLPDGAPQTLKAVVRAAGNTKVIVSGGSKQEPRSFLEEVYGWVHTGGVAGAAVGRNIFQNKPAQAQALSAALSALIYRNCSLQEAENLIRQRSE